MKPATKKVVRIVFAVFALAIGAILFGIVPVSVGFVRAPVESAVREAAGLELSIGGPIILRLGPTPSVTSSHLVLGDPAGSPLLSVDTARAKIDLFALLGGRIHVHELTADGIRADYCSPLPTFSGEPAEESAPPSVAVDAVEFGRITVRCGPPEQADPLQINIARVFAAAPADGPMRLDADVRVSGTDLTLTVTGGELDELLAESRPFAFDASLVTATAAVEVSANLQTPPAELAVDVWVEIRSADVPLLAAAFGASLPAVGALRAEGRVRTDFNFMQLVEITGELGDNRFVLDGIVDSTGERMHVGLTATFEQFDLAPFLENSAGAQSPDPATDPGDADLRPVLEMLGAFDANVQLFVTRVLGSPLVLGGMEITASLVNGLVDVQPLAAEMLGGRVSVTGSIDSQAECPEVKLLVHGGGLDLSTLNPLLALDEPIGGQIDVLDLESSSCGYGLSRHLDSLRIEAELKGGRLRIGDQLLPFAAEQLHLGIAPGERSRARLVGDLAGEQIQATLTIGSLEALLGPDAWPVNFEIQGAGSLLELDGQIGFAAGNATLDAGLEFEVPSIGTLHAWADISPDATLPLRATARVRIDESSFIADSTALSLGRSDLGGSAIWHYADDSALLDLTLRSSLLDLDEIVSALALVTEQAEAISAVADDGGTPLIPAGFTLPAVDLDISLAVINAYQLDLQEFNVSGRLRQGLIDEARVSTVLEDDVQLSGNLDLDLRSLPAQGALQVVADNVDIGQLLRNLDVADDLRLRADGLELTVAAEGKTPMQMLLNAVLEADLRGFYWYVPEDDSTTGEEPLEGFDLSLLHLQLTAGPDQRTIWASSGQVDGTQLEVWMETPSLTETFGDSPELPLTLVAAIGDNVAMLETRIDRSADADFLAHVLLSGQVVDSEDLVLAELQSPLADYELQSDIVLVEERLELPEIQLRLGNSIANGSIAVDVGGERRSIDMTLHATRLQTDDLLYWSRDFSAAAINAEEQTAAGIIGGDTDESQRDFLSIVKDYIDEFSDSGDLDFSITVDDLRAGADDLGSAEMGIYIDEDNFIVRPVRIRLPGGEVDAQYVSRIVDGRFDGSLMVHAEALRYGGLLRLADNESEARGILYLDTELNANTEWPPDAVPFDVLVNNANGSFSVAVWPENAEAGLLDLWTANLVLALLPIAPSEDVALLNCMVARLDVEDGVMQTDVALLDSTDTIIRGRGDIDLARQELKLLVAPQAKREKFLSMSTPVTVTGPFNDFQIGVEPAGLLATAMKWWWGLIYVPFKWLTGERFPADGTATCFDAMDWELTPELQEYFLRRDFSVPPPTPNE